jgi:chloramphenicol-sensitive protein RarD
MSRLALSSLLIATNWMVYIWAVNSGRVLETSLGYYITPLLMMAAGALLFRERIDRVGLAAIGLAAVGVAVQALAIGRLPWVSVVLAVSFSGYGVVRKRVAAEAQTGLLVECLLLAGPALAYVLFLQAHGGNHLASGGAAAAWLVACGPITAVPLVLFAWAARRIPMTAVGFLQFIAPTIGFVIGVGEGEAFTPLRAASFLFIWAGAALFLGGAVRKARAARLTPVQSAA